MQSTMPSVGAYQLGERLGASAYSTTYAATTQQTRVAIKVFELAAGISETERRQIVAQFQQRAQQVMMLYYNGIIPLRNSGYTEPFLYAVNGFVSGGSLADAFAGENLRLPLEAKEAAVLAEQLLDALSEAHSHGVAHGNLKPSNLFLPDRQSNIVRLRAGDFALLWNRERSLQSQGVRPQEWSYRAPEAVNAPAPTPAIDQFAAAALCYEWLTGAPPFAGMPIESRPAAAQPPSLANAALARYRLLDDILLQALHHNPQQRFASLAAFVEALAGALRETAGQHSVEKSDPANDAPEPERNASGNEHTTNPIDNIPAIPSTAAQPERPKQPETAVRKQEHASSFLLDAPIGPPQPPPNAMVMHSPAEIESIVDPAHSYGNGRQRGNSSSGGAGNSSSGGNDRQQRAKRTRKPTTSEQELIAPAAAHGFTAASHHSEIRPESGTGSFFGEIQEMLGISLSRRAALRMAGRAGLVMGIGAASVGAIKLIADHWSSAVREAQSLFPRSYRLAAPVALTGHAGAVRALAWSPDGAALISGADDDAIVRLWHPAQPNTPAVPLPVTEAVKGVTSLSWARDSRYALIGIKGANAEIWNVAAQSLVAHLPYPVEIARWHPLYDAAALVSQTSAAPEADGGKAIILWDIANAALLTSLKAHAGVVQAIDWYPQAGDFLLASGGKDNLIYSWQGSNPAAITQPATAFKGNTAPVNAVSWSSQSPVFASGSDDGSARLWHNGTSGSIATLANQTSAIAAVAWAPGIALAAVGSANGAITLWNTDTHKQAAVLPGSGSAAILSLAWEPSGQRLAAGTADKRILVWDLAK